MEIEIVEGEIEACRRSEHVLQLKKLLHRQEIDLRLNRLRLEQVEPELERLGNERVRLEEQRKPREKEE